MRWLAPVIGLAGTLASLTDDSGLEDPTQWCAKPGVIQRQEVNINLKCNCDPTWPNITIPTPRSTCQPLELVFLLDTSDSVLDDKDELFDTTKEWIYSTVTKLTEARKDCSNTTPNNRDSFIVLFQYSKNTHAEYADFVKDQTSKDNFAKALEEMVQQEANTPTFATLEKLVNFYEKFDSGVSVNKAMQSAGIKDLSYKGKNDNIDEKDWKKFSNGPEVEKVLVVITDGNARDKPNPNVMKRASDIFSRMDVILLVNKGDSEHLIHSQQNKLYDIWQNGDIYTIQGGNSYAFDVEKMANRFVGKTEECSVEVAVVVERKYCKCGDNKYKVSSQNYRDAKKFIIRALRQSYYDHLGKTNFKYMVADYTPTIVKSDEDFTYGGSKCQNQFVIRGKTESQFKRFNSNMKKLVYPQKSNRNKNTYTCARSDLSFMLTEGKKMFSGSCTKAKKCRKILIIATEGQDHQSVWLDHALQYPDNDDEISVIPVKVGDFGPEQKGEDEKFNLEQLSKPENMIFEANAKGNMKIAQNTADLVESVKDLSICPSDPKTIEPTFKCGCHIGDEDKHITVEKGPCGPKGPDGLDGIEGIRGPRGPMGEPATTGEPGLRGEDAPAGPPGESGFAGPAGPPGRNGDHGLRGDDGPPGEQGKTSNLDNSFNLEEYVEESIRQLCKCTGHKCEQPPKEPPAPPKACNMHTVFYIDAGKTTCIEGNEDDGTLGKESRRQRVMRLAQSMIKIYYTAHMDNSSRPKTDEGEETYNNLSLEVIFFGSGMQSMPILSTQIKEVKYIVPAPYNPYYNKDSNAGNLRIENVTETGIDKVMELVEQYSKEVLAPDEGCGGTPTATPHILQTLIDIQKHTRQSWAGMGDKDQKTHKNLIIVSDGQLGLDIRRDEIQAQNDWKSSNKGTYNSGWIQPSPVCSARPYQSRCSVDEEDWREMLKELYDPVGRRSGSNNTALFDYVRVAPLLLSLNVMNTDQATEDEHQRQLNTYTSWMRTFFDGDCCEEFSSLPDVKINGNITTGVQIASKKCNAMCQVSEEDPAFRVISGVKECWSSEASRPNDPTNCLDAKKVLATSKPGKFNPLGRKMDNDEKAMWALISNGLITCKQAQLNISKRLARLYHGGYNLK